MEIDFFTLLRTQLNTIIITHTIMLFLLCNLTNKLFYVGNVLIFQMHLSTLRSVRQYGSSSAAAACHSRNRTSCRPVPLLSKHTLQTSGEKVNKHDMFIFKVTVLEIIRFLWFFLIEFKNCYGIRNKIWKFQVSTMKIVPVACIWSSCIIRIMMTQSFHKGDNIW